MDEIRLAFRRLIYRPAASLAALVTLAFGIGAAAATWSLLWAVLVQPLPVREPSRLMIAGEVRSRDGRPDTTSNGFIYPYYGLFKNRGVFESIAAQWSSPQALSVSTGSVSADTAVMFASYGFFEVIGVSMAIGRSFTEDDDRRGAEPVAILTDRYWRQSFNKNPAAIGQTIEISGKLVTIVGIAGRGFRGLDLSQAPDIYLPFHTIADIASPLTNYFAEPNHRSSPTVGTMIVGRLRPGESAVQAASLLSAVDPPPGTQAKARIILTDVSTAAIPAAARAGMSKFVTLLGVTVGLLLLIGCASVGMLLLIRTEARRDEFAICLALGASRSRLAASIAVEGGLLAIAGAAFALPAAWWMFWGVRAFRLPGNVNIELLELTLDGRALTACVAGGVVATAVITLVGGAFGLYVDVADALHARSGSTPRLTQRRTRRALAVGQVAVALILLSGAGLFTRSIMQALSLNSAIDMGRILTGAVSLGSYGYTADRATVFFDNFSERLNANPAIRSAALSVTQGGMGPGGRLIIDGFPRQFPSTVWFTAVDKNHFRTMGLSILTGRGFTDDDRTNTTLVAVVSQSFGRMLADGGDPIGHRITMPIRRAQQATADVIEVVGVVSDIVTDVSVLEPPVIYLPIAQISPVASRSVTVRAAGDPDVANGEVISAIRQVDATIRVAPLLTLEERIGTQMISQRFGVYVMGALGVMAVLLTLLGTYVMAESMAILRMREMGIRAALGATRSQLAAIIFAETFRLVSVGLAAGLLVVWAGASTIRAFLFRVQPLDPTTLAIMAILILVLAMVVSLHPALRAARVDIGRVLKEQ
jgi:putative ABC transport system permease protein